MFMLGEEWVDLGLVDKLCALSLGEDEIAEEKKTKGGVEG